MLRYAPLRPAVIPQHYSVCRCWMYHPPSYTIRIPVESISMKLRRRVITLNCLNGLRLVLKTTQRLPCSLMSEAVRRFVDGSGGKVYRTSHAFQSTARSCPGSDINHSRISNQPFKVDLTQAKNTVHMVGKIPNHGTNIRLIFSRIRHFQPRSICSEVGEFIRNDFRSASCAWWIIRIYLEGQNSCTRFGRRVDTERSCKLGLIST